jgi:myo-inositol 2-dehydrogenase/D-chiro-inositol 1-dehydrogenase
VTGGQKPTPDGSDGLIALELADAALQSAKEGKAIRLKPRSAAR